MTDPVPNQLPSPAPSQPPSSPLHRWRTEFLIIASLVLIVVLALFVREYVQQREQRARAEEQAKAADAINALLKQQMQQRDIAYQQSLSQLQAIRRSVSTPQQAITRLPQVVALPEPVHTVTKAEALPNAPSVVKEGDIIVPSANIVPLFQRLATCNETDLTLGKCQADLKDTQGIAQQNEQKAKAWEQAAKGGSWIKRALRKAKVIVCAGAGAGLGAAADQRARGAAIGAVAGATVCSLF